MSTEPDAWLLKQIDSADLVKRLIAVKMSLGLQIPKDYGLKMFNAVLDAEREIERLRVELAAKNRLLDDYRRMSANQ